MTGQLAQDATIKTFQEAQEGLGAARWKSGEAQWNLEHVAEAAMRSLRGAGVPEPRLVVGNDTIGAGLGAMFDVRTWTITAAGRGFALPRTDVDDAYMQARAAALYHEARHAEQFYLAARVIAGKREMSRDKWELLMGPIYPGAVFEAAGQQGLTASTAELAEIAGWIRAYNGVSRVMKDLSDAREELVKAGEALQTARGELPAAFEDDDSAYYQARLEKQQLLAKLLKELFEKALATYVGQAHEVDAYAVSGRVGAKAPTSKTTYDNLLGGHLELYRLDIERLAGA